VNVSGWEHPLLWFQLSLTKVTHVGHWLTAKEGLMIIDLEGRLKYFVLEV
jgi:hypothetical protein